MSKSLRPHLSDLSRDISVVTKLNWALTFATLKKSVWQVIGFAIGILALGGLVVWSWGSALAVPVKSTNAAHVGSILSALWAIGTLFIAIAQIAMFGQGGLNARDLYRYGLSSLSIRASLVVSSFFSPSGIALFFALWGATGILAGRLSTNIGITVCLWVISALTSVMAVIMSFTVLKVVITGVLTLIRSKKTRGIISFVFIVLFILLMQLPSFMSMSISGHADQIAEIAGNAQNLTEDQVNSYYAEAVSASFASALGSFQLIGRILAFTPLSSANVIVFDILDGSVLGAALAVLRVAIWAAGLWILGILFGMAVRNDVVHGVVGRDGEVSSSDSAVKLKSHGLGLFGLNVVRNPMTSIMARLIMSWSRDMRYGLNLFMPVLMTAILVVEAFSLKEMAVLVSVLPFNSILLSLMGVNMLAYEGPAFIMHTYAAVKGRIDWWARSLVQLILGVVMLVIIAAVTYLIGWKQIPGTEFAVSGMVSLMMLCNGIGISAILSPLMLYPVPSADQPMKRPQGAVVARLVVPLVWFAGFVIGLAPGGITAAVTLGLVKMPVMNALIIAGVVQAITSLAILIAGNELGGIIEDSRRLKIQETLRNFVQLNH